MSEIVDAPVIIVGDIDRGGVFASLAGTMMLLSEEERRRVKGVIINKFRGRKELLEKGITCSMAVVEIVTKDSERKLFVNVPTYLYKIMEVMD